MGYIDSIFLTSMLSAAATRADLISAVSVAVYVVHSYLLDYAVSASILTISYPTIWYARIITCTSLLLFIFCFCFNR